MALLRQYLEKVRAHADDMTQAHRSFYSAPEAAHHNLVHMRFGAVNSDRAELSRTASRGAFQKGNQR